MSEDILQKFNNQLEYEPQIENLANFKSEHKKFVICGMGGSNIAPGVIKDLKPEIDIIVHRDYGLPRISDRELKDRLIIVSSYSGLTAETITSLEEAISKNLDIIVVSKDGKILEIAEKNKIAYIRLPDMNLQPRFAVLLSMKAILKAMGEDEILANIKNDSFTPDLKMMEDVGNKFSEEIDGKTPLIYSASHNSGLSYLWKINFNETPKVPCFVNIFPELNHNEMLGFTSKISDGKLSDKFIFIFINVDQETDQRIQKRMILTKKILEENSFKVLSVDLSGINKYQKILNGIFLSYYVSFALAKQHGIDIEDTSVLDSFKSAIG